MSAGIHVQMLKLRSTSPIASVPAEKRRSGQKSQIRLRRRTSCQALRHRSAPAGPGCSDHYGANQVREILQWALDLVTAAANQLRPEQKDTGTPPWQGNNPHRSVTSGLLGDA
jgi:hypothetical protein